MDFFIVYLLCVVGLFFFLFLLVLSVVALVDCCKSCIVSVRYDERRWFRRRNMMMKIRLPTWRSLWPCRNRNRANIPFMSRWHSQVVSSVHCMPQGARQSNTNGNAPHRMPQGGRQSNSTINAPHRMPQGGRQSNTNGNAPHRMSHGARQSSNTVNAPHRMPHGDRQSNATVNAPPAANQSERAVPLPTRPHQRNAGVNVPPLATQQSSITVPMPCGCRTHQSNIFANVPLQTMQPQTMTPMRYRPNLSNAMADIPVTILQSQIMAHIIHGSHQSQTMTPMRYGSETNARAHTPHGPHQRNSQATCQPQRMVPEPREGPNGRNPDSGAYISASIYQKYENDKKTECAVCLGELKKGERVMRMPVCSHLYHEKCICRWLLQEPSCPLCRSPVRAELSVRVGHS